MAADDPDNVEEWLASVAGDPSMSLVQKAMMLRASRKLSLQRRVLSFVDRMMRQHGRWTEEGYFFRGLQDPEMGRLAALVVKALTELEDDRC